MSLKRLFGKNLVFCAIIWNIEPRPSFGSKNIIKCLVLLFQQIPLLARSSCSSEKVREENFEQCPPRNQVRREMSTFSTLFMLDIMKDPNSCNMSRYSFNKSITNYLNRLKQQARTNCSQRGLPLITSNLIAWSTW